MPTVEVVIRETAAVNTTDLIVIVDPVGTRTRGVEVYSLHAQPREIIIGPLGQDSNLRSYRLNTDCSDNLDPVPMSDLAKPLMGPRSRHFRT